MGQSFKPSEYSIENAIKEAVRYNLLSRTRVPEVPQLPSENRIVQNPPALRITVAFLIKTEEEIK